MFSFSEFGLNGGAFRFVAILDQHGRALGSDGEFPGHLQGAIWRDGEGERTLDNQRDV